MHSSVGEWTASGCSAMSLVVALASSVPRSSGSHEKLSSLAAGLSKRCGGMLRGLRWKLRLVSLAMVSDMVLKVGDDCVQPMVEDMGMATSCGSSL